LVRVGGVEDKPNANLGLKTEVKLPDGAHGGGEDASVVQRFSKAEGETFAGKKP